MILGGSGGLSGTLARMALKQGNEVWTVTRGKRSLPEGVHPITVDRNEEEAFAKALNDCQMRWDSVYDPDHKKVPQDENGEAYVHDSSYAGLKRQMEEVFLAAQDSRLNWTLFRP